MLIFKHLQHCFSIKSFLDSTVVIEKAAKSSKLEVAPDS